MLPTDFGVLELDKLKALVATYALSSSGKSGIESLEPSVDLVWIRAELQATDEIIAITRHHGGLPLQGLEDIGDVLERLAKAATLDVDSIVAVGNHLRVAHRVQTFLHQHEVSALYPETARRTAFLTTFPDLEAQIAATLTPEGEIRDDATPELRRIRAGIQKTRVRVQEHLESLLRRPEYAEAIQERVITIRNDRYVIPVKHDCRGQIRGIVQGYSGSGVTAFVEPLAVVEMNNGLHDLFHREQQEIQRILRALSDAMREQLGSLRANADALATADVLQAKARFCLDYSCVSPTVQDEAVIALRNARHPLLEHHFRQERRNSPAGPSRQVVPLTVRLGGDVLGVVITGPNTGGKTVALKTIGLLALMAQSGLPIPAEQGSVVGVFDAVCADVGDEQSIEQNLSTFSSHMTRIIRILARATPRTMALLDEIGVGTDPTEGTALAMALVDAFARRRSLLVATTHFGALKVHAHSHPRLMNAAMEFDDLTLSPTYRLIEGVPGSSNALQIAERLGLPPDVLDDARSRLGEKTIAIEELIRDLDRLRRELETEHATLRAALRQAEEREREHRDRLSELKSRRGELLRAAQDEAASVLAEARGVVERAVADIRRTNASRESIREARRAVTEALASVGNRPAAEDEREERPAFVPGDVVLVKTMRATGEVVEPPDDRGLVRVRVGTLSVAVPVAGVERVEAATRVVRRPSGFLAVQSERRAVTSPTLTLLGMRVAEALEAADKYLDDAVLAGLEQVTLIHGKGTGAVRQGLHELLRDHPHVAGFRLGALDEGGAGITVVSLRG